MNGKFTLCPPARTGSAIGLVTGLVVWALVSFVPAFHSGVPEPIVAVIPFVLAWLGHTAAAWIAPHPAAAPAPAAPAAPTPTPGGGGLQGNIQVIPPAAGTGGFAPSAGTGGFPPSAFPAGGRIPSPPAATRDRPPGQGPVPMRYYPPGPGWRRW
jgi:hypothetical protein